MSQTFTTLEAPRFENGKRLLIAGIARRYDSSTSTTIPAQWQGFAPWLQAGIAGQVGNATYGVKSNFDEAENFDYLCGVEVADFSDLPAEWSTLRIAQQHYAVFMHTTHVSEVRRTWETIWNKWLPEAGMQVVDAPHFERYDERFDPRTGLGGFEIWLPVQELPC